MSEDAAMAGSVSAEHSPSATAGEMLRTAREASGLHIATLAVALKVPVKKLEALEADRLDLLPDSVFVRALAASVCRTLKIDPAPVLEKLPGTAAPRLASVQSGINTPFRAPSDGPGPGWKEQLTRPVMLMVLALLLGALILIFLPVPEPVTKVTRPQQAEPAAIASEPPAAPMLPMARDMAVPGNPAAVVASAAAATASVATSSIPALVSTPAVAVLPKAVVPAVPAAAVGGGTVVFKARGESWVEVTDAKGQVALRRTLAPGESAEAAGALPLAVIVGKADVTQVSVRGKPLDLAPLAKDNVARFEVK